ncbi:hypothetical protein MA16_Dca020524 [Dendrobium catenatum]|uniref:Uncharacterized protein n=1 Tax=Dendrobium catenatum TaxID=906689 RepID=A0A2I0XA71_9ASPA|nr:hypothetical protein MA16_Dca020524 [Dendrobium catenatum]
MAIDGRWSSSTMGTQSNEGMIVLNKGNLSNHNAGLNNDTVKFHKRRSNGPLIIKENVHNVFNKTLFVEGKGNGILIDSDCKTPCKVISPIASPLKSLDMHASSSGMKFFSIDLEIQIQSLATV